MISLIGGIEETNKRGSGRAEKRERERGIPRKRLLTIVNTLMVTSGMNCTEGCLKGKDVFSLLG